MGSFHGHFHIFNNLILVVDFQQQTKVWLEKKRGHTKKCCSLPPSRTCIRGSDEIKLFRLAHIKCKCEMYHLVFLMSTKMSTFDFSNILTSIYEAVRCLSCTFTFFWMRVCVCGWWVTSKHCVPHMYYVWQRLRMHTQNDLFGPPLSLLSPQRWMAMNRRVRVKFHRPRLQSLTSAVTLQSRIKQNTERRQRLSLEL